MQHTISESEYAYMVAVDNGRPVTTSMKVAEYFGKRHKDVLRKIKLMKCSPEFNQRNFAPVEYIDSKGQRRPMYEMTKDGFIFLAFSFTGVKADAIKETYINAFNWMAERLKTFDHRRNELSALYASGQYAASLCGKGLNGWKHDKRDLEEKMDQLEIEGQLTMPFLEFDRDASNEVAA